jgi:hypothetical protein
MPKAEVVAVLAVAPVAEQAVVLGQELAAPAQAPVVERVPVLERWRFSSGQHRSARNDGSNSANPGATMNDTREKSPRR